mgnify:CR=1 FL=1
MCNNKVIFHVPFGRFLASVRETRVPCGQSDPWGGRAICDTCASDPVVMRSIRQHEENIAADNAALRSAGWGEM